MLDGLKFFFNRLRERLWVRPLVVSIISVAAVFLVRYVESFNLHSIVPDITRESIVTLLSIIAASMLVIATFAVASMVSAFASAATSATPRSFSLIVSDDGSQNALSTFIGAFIFSIVALVAVQNSVFDKTGRFALFILTMSVFIIVIVTFVKWVDQIARLGRLRGTIEKVEAATAAAIARRRRAPTLNGVPIGKKTPGNLAVYAEKIGYVHRIDVDALQSIAKRDGVRIRVMALPGTFSAPGQQLAIVMSDTELETIDVSNITKAFLIGNNRVFDEDPRFGLITLSEIASRALSPGINDPGTAIEVIGSFVRLFAPWSKQVEDCNPESKICDRVEVPELSMLDMFDDSFAAISRDGAGTIEVVIRLQKALYSLAYAGNNAMHDAAMHLSNLSLQRAENALDLPFDLGAARAAAPYPQRPITTGRESGDLMTQHPTSTHETTGNTAR